MRELTLPQATRRDRRASAQVLAELIREGVTFRAEVVATPDGPTLKVTFTGGF